MAPPWTINRAAIPTGPPGVRPNAAHQSLDDRRPIDDVGLLRGRTLDPTVRAAAWAEVSIARKGRRSAGSERPNGVKLLTNRGQMACGPARQASPHRL